MKRSRTSIGEQGVALVIAELLVRDFKPYRPVVDDHGVDIMLPDGLRIQVKAANLSRSWAMNRKTGKSGPTGKLAYQFSLQRTVFGTKEKLQTVGITYEYRDVYRESDFLILVGFDERRFWIIPTSLVDGCKHVSLVQGLSYAKKSLRTKFWYSVREGEGRWDLLRDWDFKRKTDLPQVDIAALNLDEPRDEIASFAGWMN
ncbi:MAG TPA: hypothetical protein VN861_03195 [Candidatus Acidoferrales bacterium]|nr:hypothetical protein [Candidatus Acidoferrales bacterium]